MDFDFTFGNGLETDQENLASGRYETFTTGRIVHSYLYEKLMTIPAMKTMYEGILKDAITKMFNSQAIEPRIGGLAYMLQHEVVWDQALTRQSKGTSRQWSAADYLKTLDTGINDLDLMYGIRQWISLKEKTVKLQLGLIQPAKEPEEVHVGEPQKIGPIKPNAAVPQPVTS
jgi:hypothetical protein